MYVLSSRIKSDSPSSIKKKIFWNDDIFRFANIFELNNVDKIWSVVKIRKSMTQLDMSCDHDVLSDDSMLSQVKAVEQKLNTESSEQISDTLTNEDLKTVGEMFLYLNMCPDTIKPWLLFYKDVLLTKSPDQIILAFNRLIKGTTNDFFKNMAEIFLKRILSMLPGSEHEIIQSKVKANLTQELKGN